MDIKTKLLERANSKCELCGSTSNLESYNVPPYSDDVLEQSALLCDNCLGQVNDPSALDKNHWHCLNESMWSEHAAVQVIAWRMLTALSSEGWASDLLEQMYLEDENLEWAKTGLQSSEDSGAVTKDSNGAILVSGDSVTIIKDLDVKGAGFTAKRGTIVRKISVGDDPELIEGRVNGTMIYLKTCFLKKSN